MPSDFFGHKKQIELLRKSLQNGRLAHAYLFYGPDGIGKFTLAKLIAKGLCCENHTGWKNFPDGACGACLFCRQIDSLTHPQVVVLGLEHTLTSKKEKRKDIPIEDLRELKRLFSYAAAGDGWRVAIIREADKMSKDAANSFLKLLEEPGDRTLFILTAASREIILPTILSRTQPVAFRPLPDGEMEKMLAGYASNGTLRREILYLSDGRPGRALALLQNPSLLEKEKKVLRYLKLALNRESAPDIFYLSEKSAQDERLRVRIKEILIKLLREKMLRDPPSADPLPTADKIKNIEKISELLDTTNLNPRLAMDMMLLNYTRKVKIN